jgi:hypothetical protein
MEGYCSTGQSPQRALVPMEEEEEQQQQQQQQQKEPYENMYFVVYTFSLATSCHLHPNEIVSAFFFKKILTLYTRL